MDGSYTEWFKSAKRKVVGLKQTLISLQRGECRGVILAIDCDEQFRSKVIRAASDVPIVSHFTKMQLGKLCGIDVKAGVVGILKD